MLNLQKRKPFEVLENLLAVAVIFLQAIVWLYFPTDNNGDPKEYLLIARQISISNPVPSGVTPMRSIGYPLFIKIFSFNLSHLNIFFFFQSLTFLLALGFFIDSSKLSSRFRWLLFLPALIPPIAYQQKLLFPDGLLLSLTLVFVALIIKERYGLAFAVGCLAFLIKIAFGFLPGLALYFVIFKKTSLKTFLKVFYCSRLSDPNFGNYFICAFSALQ